MQWLSWLNQPDSGPVTLSNQTVSRALVFTFFLQVIENPLDHHWVFDAGNHLHSTPAFPAGFDVNVA